MFPCVTNLLLESFLSNRSRAILETMSIASTLTNQIIATIYSSGGYAWRSSSVGVFDQRVGGYRASSKKGVSDVLGCYHGIFIAIEVKIGKDRLSDEQTGFISNIRHAGGFASVVKTLPEFQEQWIAVKQAIDKTQKPC